MKTFEIREQGQVFATIEARTPQSALRKAHKQSRKVGSEAYNGWSGEETWHAWGPEDEHAEAIVRIHARGCTLVSVS